MTIGKRILDSLKRHIIAIGMCAVIAIFYFSQSDPWAIGFYQQDEVGHFMQMINFWDDPLTILTDMWARGGYKILYAIPGLAGWAGITATNIFFAVGSGFLAYLLALRYGLRNAWLAIVFTGLQPLMITLGFRCYPELPATFFTMLLLYMYRDRRYISASLIASFLFTIRQELAILAILIGVIFLLRKQWVPLLCLLAAPLAMTILGYIKHHDLFYVVHMMIEGGLKEDYRRNGFFYLWVMLPDLTGILVFYLLVASAVAFILHKHKKQVLVKYHMPLLVFVVYFLMHCVFTSVALGFGRSGGATRFLLPILPIVSLFALGGLNYLLYHPERVKRIIVAGASVVPALAVLLFLDYFKGFSIFGFNTLSYTDINLGLLILLFLAILAGIYLPAMSRQILYVIPSLVIIYGVKCVAPIGLSNENLIARTAAEWLYDTNVNFDKLYSNHVMFTYYYGLKSGSYDAALYDSVNYARIKQNDIIVYDTHYASKSVSPQFFNRYRAQCQLLHQFLGDNNFKMFLIRGLAAP